MTSKYDKIYYALRDQLTNETLDKYTDRFKPDWKGEYKDLIEQIALRYMLNHYDYDVRKGLLTIRYHNAIFALLEYLEVEAPKPDKLREYQIYKRTGPTGKVYIGLTSQSEQSRAKEGRGYYDNPKMLVDILEYGWDSFTTEIIAEHLTPDEADYLETQKIQEYNAVEEGYNNDSKQPKR